MTRYAVPLAIFAALVALLAVGLTLNPREIPSPFIGKPAPAYDLPRLYKADARTTNREQLGKVWLLNVWASWCGACQQEHPLIVQLARRGIEIVGLNYKDENAKAKQWLQRFGNPYRINAVDADGNTGLDWGVYGVPETFVIDKRGIVRYKHIGPLDGTAIKEKILPLIDALKGEAA